MGGKHSGAATYRLEGIERELLGGDDPKAKPQRMSRNLPSE